MSDKIEDNPSFKKHRNDLKGAKTIKQIATLLSPFSKTAKDIKKALEGLNDLEIDFKKISKKSYHGKSKTNSTVSISCRGSNFSIILWHVRFFLHHLCTWSL